MGRLPREARDGIMRVWFDILREKQPGVSWVIAKQEPFAPEAHGQTTDDVDLATSA